MMPDHAAGPDMKGEQRSRAALTPDRLQEAKNSDAVSEGEEQSRRQVRLAIESLKKGALRQAEKHLGKAIAYDPKNTDAFKKVTFGVGSIILKR